MSKVEKIIIVTVVILGALFVATSVFGVGISYKVINIRDYAIEYAQNMDISIYSFEENGVKCFVSVGKTVMNYNSYTHNISCVPYETASTTPTYSF